MAARPDPLRQVRCETGDSGSRIIGLAPLSVEKRSDRKAKEPTHEK